MESNIRTASPQATKTTVYFESENAVCLAEGIQVPTELPSSVTHRPMTPTVFSDLMGHSFKVDRDQKRELWRSATPVQAMTHFANQDRIAVLSLPHRQQPASLYLHATSDGAKRKHLPLPPSDDHWTDICWLDSERLLLSFQGRVSCSYAIYNITKTSLELEVRDRCEGAFELRGKTLWCLYSSQPKTDHDREEQVWPRP